MTDINDGRLNGPSQAEPVVSALRASVPDAWQANLANSVVALIREVGIYRLGGSNGCPCTDFEVQNVHVAVSCHKSGYHGVRVWTHDADYCGPDRHIITDALRPIADEVLRQVDDYYDAGGEYAATFEVSFEPIEHDGRARD